MGISARRQVSIWSVVLAVSFAAAAFACVAATSNGTNGAALYGLLAAAAFGVFVYVRVLAARPR